MGARSLNQHIAVLKRGEVWGRVLCLCPMPARAPHVTEKGYTNISHYKFNYLSAKGCPSSCSASSLFVAVIWVL